MPMSVPGQFLRLYWCASFTLRACHWKEWQMNTIPSATAASEQALVDCLPSLHRWAHNRVPAACRGRFDARDLVQEAGVRTWPRPRHPAMRHPGALAGYLRQAVMNIVRDEARRTARRPVSTELPENVAGCGPTPLETL